MGGSRWLSATQQHDWRAYIQGSAKLADGLERDLKARHGLSLAEYEILVQLSEAPERRLRMAELAASASQSRSRLTHTVARLESKGFVSREDCPSDKRGVFARLTDGGFAALTKAAADHVRAVRDLFIDVVEPGDLRAVGRAFRAVAERVG
ncbi:MAG: MarR family winged helix-turn-helix transcriptional regulator [Micromonosporaceae bacterium]